MSVWSVLQFLIFLLLNSRPLAGVAMRVVMHPKAHVDDHPEPHAMAKFNDKIKALAGTLEFHRATFEVCAVCLCIFKSMRAYALVLILAFL